MKNLGYADLCPDDLEFAMVPDRPDVKLLKTFSDDTRLELLLELLEQRATQKELGARFGLPSGSMSRHLRELELAGLVARERAHGAYHVIHPRQTRALIESAAQLADELAAAHSEAATRNVRAVRKAGLKGGHLRDGERKR